MHFNQISRCKWHLTGSSPKIDENLVWTLSFWLFLTEISNDSYLPFKNYKLNLKKLAKFDLGVLLNNNESHKKAIIPTLLFHIENQIDLDSHLWSRILNNFRHSPSINIHVYYDIVKKTNLDTLNCIVLFSLSNEEDFRTETFFTDRGKGFITKQESLVKIFENVDKLISITLIAIGNAWINFHSFWIGRKLKVRIFQSINSFRIKSESFQANLQLAVFLERNANFAILKQNFCNINHDRTVLFHAAKSNYPAIHIRRLSCSSAIWISHKFSL